MIRKSRPSFIHIGNLINTILIEKKVSKADLARKLDRKPVSINAYLKQSTLQTRIIFELSKALNYDIFEHLSNVLNGTDNKSRKQELESLNEQVKDLQKENTIYKDLLKR